MNARNVIVTLGLLAATGCGSTGEVAFEMHAINADSRFEGAGAIDINNDGQLDIASGGFWYEAPDWNKHLVREVAEEGGYYLDFASLPLDVDGDG
jgi:hypothetical protein